MTFGDGASATGVVPARAYPSHGTYTVRLTVTDRACEGNFRWTASFGGTSLTAAGPSLEDVYVAKYTAAGAPVWAQQLGGVGSDFGNGVAVTPTGDPLVAGTFNGSGGFAGDLLSSAGSSDAFVAKMAP